MDFNKERPDRLNAKAKLLYSEKFFGENSPEILLRAHEQWLRQNLQNFGAPIDDMTWSVFNNVEIDRQKTRFGAPELRSLERKTYESVGNILQALAWYHFPDHASWTERAIMLPITPEIFVDHKGVTASIQESRKINRRWSDQMEHYKSDLFCYGKRVNSDAKFIFEVNEHYEGVTGTLRLNEEYVHGRVPHGIKCTYNTQLKMLNLSFQNPNDFMGWMSDAAGNTEYRLGNLNRFLLELVTGIKNGDQDLISVQTWRAY